MNPAYNKKRNKRVFMIEFYTAVFQGVMAFTATNIDDLLILMLFFSQVNS